MTDALRPLDELLSARTPAEAKRHWMIDRMWAGSVGAVLVLVGLIGIIWRGGWSPATEALRLQALALIALGGVGYQFVVVIAYSLGGPVGRWQARWKDKSFTAEDDEAARAAYDGRGAS